MKKPVYIFVLILLLCAAIRFGSLIYLSIQGIIKGSFESFPTEEQIEAGRIVWIIVGSFSALVEASIIGAGVYLYRRRPK